MLFKNPMNTNYLQSLVCTVAIINLCIPTNKKKPYFLNKYHSTAIDRIKYNQLKKFNFSLTFFSQPAKAVHELLDKLFKSEILIRTYPRE